jgi:hypothetical protein
LRNLIPPKNKKGFRMIIRSNHSQFTHALLAAGLMVVTTTAVGQDQGAPRIPASAAAQGQIPGGAAPAGARRGRGAELPSVPWKPVYLPDGQPDWQGFWRANPGGDSYDITGSKDRPDYLLQGDGKPKPGTRRITGTPDGKIPYQPWAAAHYKELFDNIDDPTKPEYVDTQARCLLEGPGRVFIHSGFEVLQTPGYIVFLTEQNDEQVIVKLDGSPHVGKDIQLWQGDRRGHWENDRTLVVDVTNVKGKSRLDMTGNFYSPATHFVERYTRVDDNTIKYEATVTDPEVYTQPWTLNIRFQRSHLDDPSYELWEDACHEGERSSNRLVISPEAAKVNAAAAKAAAEKAKLAGGTLTNQ